jgi:hypothetical protein
MVEKNFEIRVKGIKTYSGLKKSNPWDLILINGRTELKVGSSLLFENAPMDFDENKIYTLSLEGEFIVQNNYTNYDKKDRTHLTPVMKTSYKIGSYNNLGNKLLEIAVKGGLL